MSGCKPHEEPNLLRLMLQRCLANKQPYAEEVLKNFLIAVEEPQTSEQIANKLPIGLIGG